MLTTRGYDNYSNLLGRVLERVLKIESSRGEYHFFCLSIFESSTRLVLKFPSESSFKFSSFFAHPSGDIKVEMTFTGVFNVIKLSNINYIS